MSLDDARTRKRWSTISSMSRFITPFLQQAAADVAAAPWTASACFCIRPRRGSSAGSAQAPEVIEDLRRRCSPHGQ